MLRIEITICEENLIKEILKDSSESISAEFKDGSIIFHDDDSALNIEELIQDKLVKEGFNYDYSENMIGNICQNLIDKFYKALNEN
jgi:hypothetical protein